MTEEIKSDLWDINATARVTFRRVYFDDFITEKEAIERFKGGAFSIFDEADTSWEDVIEIKSLESY